MPAAIALRPDWDSEKVLAAALVSRDVKQYRRLLAIAAVYRGLSRCAAAAVGGMDRQTLRDHVHRFNAAGPEGLIDRPPPGMPSKLTAAHKAELAAIVERGPDPERDGIVRWRCRDLCVVVEQRFRVAVSEVTIGRVLKELGFSHISARPRHPRQDAQEIEIFKKTSKAW